LVRQYAPIDAVARALVAATQQFCSLFSYFTALREIGLKRVCRMTTHRARGTNTTRALRRRSCFHSLEAARILLATLGTKAALSPGRA
jgi:hypothetical protein